MRAALLVSAIIGLAALPGAASAEGLGRACADKPQGEYLTLQQLRTRVVEQGYQIRSDEIGKGCGGFYALDRNGKRAELFSDPTSGRIILASGDRDDRRGGKSGDRDDRRGKDKDGDD